MDTCFPETVRCTVKDIQPEQGNADHRDACGDETVNRKQVNPAPPAIIPVQRDDSVDNQIGINHQEDNASQDTADAVELSDNGMWLFFSQEQ